MSVLAHLKGLSRHSAIYSLSTVIQRAQGLVLLPILTDTAYLATKSEFGDYALIYTFIAFMNVFYLYGIDAAFLRYYFLGKHTRKDIYRSAVQILALTAVLTSVLIYLFSGPLSRLIFGSTGYEFFVEIAAGILLLDTLCNLPYLILRAEEKSILYSSIRVGRFVIELVLNLVFIIYLQLGVKGVLYANLCAALVNLIVLLPVQARYIGGKFRTDAFRDLLRFGLPMIPNGLAYLAVEISDRYLMLHLLDKSRVGEYTANYKFGTLMLLLVTAFRTAWQPFFLKVASDPEAKKIYSTVMNFYILGAACVVLAGSMFVEYIVQYPLFAGKSLLGQAYWGGIKIIPIILLSYFFFGIYVNLTVGVYIRKKSHLMFIFTGLAAAANIGSNFYLMPAYGMMGAAFATLLAYLVMSGTIFFANQRIYRIPYHYLSALGIITYMTGGLLIFYLAEPGFYMRLLVVLGLPVLFYLFYALRRRDR